MSRRTTKVRIILVIVVLFLVFGLLPRWYFYSMDKARGQARQLRCRKQVSNLYF